VLPCVLAVRAAAGAVRAAAGRARCCWPCALLLGVRAGALLLGRARGRAAAGPCALLLSVRAGALLLSVRAAADTTPPHPIPF
jgi:hypothetical protein